MNPDFCLIALKVYLVRWYWMYDVVSFVKFVTTWWIPGGRLESSAVSEFPWRKRTASLPPLRSALGSLLRSSPYVRADPFGSEMKVTGIICHVVVKSPFFIQNPKNTYVSWNRRRSFRSQKIRLNVWKVFESVNFALPSVQNVKKGLTCFSRYSTAPSV